MRSETADIFRHRSSCGRPAPERVVGISPFGRNDGGVGVPKFRKRGISSVLAPADYKPVIPNAERNLIGASLHTCRDFSLRSFRYFGMTDTNSE